MSVSKSYVSRPSLTKLSKNELVLPKVLDETRKRQKITQLINLDTGEDTSNLHILEKVGDASSLKFAKAFEHV